MHNDWILDVLADLRSFAEVNGMPRLASHLDETTLLAATEIADSRNGAVRPMVLDLVPQSAKDRLNKGL
jgi:hypothetical protein